MLVCGAQLVIFELEWGIQGWLWGVWGGCASCTGSVGVHHDWFTPVGVLIDECTPVVCWAVDGRKSILVSPGTFRCWWCGLSDFGLSSLELTWDVSNVVVSSLGLMLDCP